MAQENYNTFDFTPYESNFATGRREELADRTKQEFDTNKAEYDVLQRAIGSLETTDFNKKYVDQMRTDIEKKMEGVLQTGRYDLAGFGVDDSLTRYMTDNTVKNAVESFQTIKKEDQLIAANPNKYKKYYEVPVMLDENQNEWTAADYKDPNKQGVAKLDANKNPIMKDLRQEHDAATGAYLGNSEEALDHVARATTMMSHIANDTNFIEKMIYSYKRAGIQIDAATAKKFILNGTAITDDKVTGIADELIDEYASTPEGLQRIQTLSLELSPNVEYYGKDPLMQLNSDEEIRQILLNDLKAAGQTQIGQTMTITGIPQESKSTVVNNFDRNMETLVERDSEGRNFDAINTAQTETLEEIKNNNSKIYDVNGNLRDVNSIPASDDAAMPLPPMDADGNPIVSGKVRLKRIKEELANNSLKDGATSILQIPNPNDRAVYIIDKYGKNKPPGATDAAFVHEIEQIALNESEKLNHIHLFRDAPEQDGTKSGAQLAAGQLNAVIYNAGVQIFDPERYGNSESGQKDHQTSLSLDEWSTREDNDRPGMSMHNNATAKNALLKGIQNVMNNDFTEDNGVRVLGVSMDSNYPGAVAVTYSPTKTFFGDEGDSKPRTIYIQYGNTKEKMLAPAVPYLNFLKDPLTARNISLPSNIAQAAGMFPGVNLGKGQEVRMQNKINYSVDANGKVTGIPERVIYIANADGSKVKGTAQIVTPNDIYKISQSVLKIYSKYGPHMALATDNTN